MQISITENQRAFLLTPFLDQFLTPDNEFVEYIESSNGLVTPKSNYTTYELDYRQRRIIDLQNKIKDFRNRDESFFAPNIEDCKKWIKRYEDLNFDLKLNISNIRVNITAC